MSTRTRMSKNGGGELAEEDLFVALCSTRRLHVIRYLHDNDGTAELRDVVTQVAAWENDKPADELTRNEQRRVYISLYQTHLPKLEEQGIVDWDDERNVVSLLDDDRLELYMNDDVESVDNWHQYYLLLAIGSALFVSLVVLDVSVFGSISPLASTGLVMVAVFLTALVHRLRRT